MKKMILTALATEQSFADQGEAQYYLVFNHGELRIPVTEEAAKVVVAAMYGATSNEEEVDERPRNGNGERFDAEDERPDGEVYDEDGVGQV